MSNLSLIGSPVLGVRQMDERYRELVTSETFDSDFGSVVANRTKSNRVLVSAALTEFLESNLSRSEQRQIAITQHGSSGRDERGIGSKDDIVIAGDTEVVHRTHDLLKDCPVSNRFMEIDQRPIGDSSILFFDPERKLPFPCRTFDSTVIFRNKASNVEETRKRILLQELAVNFKKTIEVIKERRRKYKAVLGNGGTQTFQGRGIEHFNLESGVMRYKGDQESYGSFKHSALRFVQNIVIHEIVSLARGIQTEEELDSRIGFFADIPQNTGEKLLYFSDFDLLKLPIAEVEELIRLYEYFLWLYHKSQYEFAKNGVTEVQIPDPQLTSENIRDLIKITEKGLLK